MDSPPTDRRSWGLCLALLIAAALAIHIIDFPPRYQYRHIDEESYVEGGLALWEGITPTYKYSPAGPQTWISWTCAGWESARHLLFPDSQVKEQPAVLKPFAAGSEALFDFYRDWSMLRQIEVVANILIAVAAVAAGFGLGGKRAGLPGALLVGGLVAVLPVFVEIGDEARPYMMGWGAGIIALYFSAASADKPARPTASAIWMGIAIATRIDMLLLLPLAFADLWSPGHRKLAQLGKLARYTAICLIVMQLVSPWVLTNLIGNLRIIATVRLAEPANGPVSAWDTIRGVLVGQGLLIPILLLAPAIFTSPPGSRRRWIVGVYALLLALSMLKATGFGLQHQGGPLVAVVVICGIGMAGLAFKNRQMALGVAVAGLLLPAIQCGIFIAHRLQYPTPTPTQWIESHVPAGTRIYLTGEMRSPLPTTRSAAAIWNEVIAPDAWQKKERTALTRFHSDADELPRAFSEENMIIERGYRRKWFILGGEPAAEPRYDITIYGNAVFGLGADPKLAVKTFLESGGVMISPDDHDIDLGPPKMIWGGPGVPTVRLYCSPDLRLIGN